MKTLPAQMLRHTALLTLPQGVDGWQETLGAGSITLSRVHVQVSEGVQHSMQNAEVQMRARLWYDCRLSRPAGLDFVELFRQAEAANAPLTCTIGGAVYNVTAAIRRNDGFGGVHHYELEMS